jgi:pilus assembly protein Flp/PilA
VSPAKSPCRRHKSAEQNNEPQGVVMSKLATRFLNDESGATAIEYGLIAAIVGIGIIVGLGALRDGLNNLFNNVKTQLSK